MKHSVDLDDADLSNVLMRIDRLTEVLKKLLLGKITITWEAGK